MVESFEQLAKQSGWDGSKARERTGWECPLKVLICLSFEYIRISLSAEAVRVIRGSECPEVVVAVVVVVEDNKSTLHIESSEPLRVYFASPDGSLRSQIFAVLGR